MLLISQPARVLANDTLLSLSQFLVHRQCCKCNVGLVEKVNHEENENERDDPRSELADGARLNFGCATDGHFHLVCESHDKSPTHRHNNTPCRGLLGLFSSKVPQLQNCRQPFLYR